MPYVASPKKKSRRSSKRRKSIKARRLSIGVELQKAISSTSKSLRSSKKAASPAPVASDIILESKSEVLKPTQAPVVETERPHTARPLTQPKAPHFAVEERLRAHQRPASAPTADMLIEKLELEAQKKRAEMKRAQSLYQKLKKNGFKGNAPSSTTATATKKITIPKTPQSKLDQKYGKRVPSLLRETSPKVVKEEKKDTRNKGVTVPVPFHFATDQRLSNQHGPGATLSATEASQTDGALRRAASLTAAELAQKFMTDTRSFALPVSHSFHAAGPSSSVSSPRGLTVALSPKLQTEIRAKSAQRSRQEEEEEQKPCSCGAPVSIYIVALLRSFRCSF